jgi:hypothetical protein
MVITMFCPKFDAAMKSYNDIVRIVSSIPQNSNGFKQLFAHEDGRLAQLNLSKLLRRSEHNKLYLSFSSRSFWNVAPGLNARASRFRKNSKSLKFKSFVIQIFIDSPDKINKNKRKYNAWFAKNLLTFLLNPKIKEYYIHEFIHVMDFRRLDPLYLKNRALTARQRENGLDGKKNFDLYVNNPLELNAYFYQGLMSLIHAKEENTKNPHKFVKRFMRHLPKVFRKNMNEKSEKKVIKRAYKLWLNDRDHNWSVN